MVDGPNMYVYCGGEPVGNVDSFGTYKHENIYKTVFRKKVKIGERTTYTRSETILISTGLLVSSLIFLSASAFAIFLGSIVPWVPAKVLLFGAGILLLIFGTALGVYGLLLDVCVSKGKGFFVQEKYLLPTAGCA